MTKILANMDRKPPETFIEQKSMGYSRRLPLNAVGYLLTNAIMSSALMTSGRTCKCNKNAVSILVAFVVGSATVTVLKTLVLPDSLY